MDANVWDTKISGMESITPLSYREPGPLEGCPGSDSYFKAVMSSMRREVESRRGVFSEPKPRASTLTFRVIQRTSKALSPQHCDGCGRFMRGVKCKAFTLYPWVVCLPCSKKVEKNCPRRYGDLVPAKIGRD